MTISIQQGDKVQFLYNGKLRQGTVENTWGERTGRQYRAAGFCVDHGSYYKSYRRNKAQFLAKLT